MKEFEIHFAFNGYNYRWLFFVIQGEICIMFLMFDVFPKFIVTQLSQAVFGLNSWQTWLHLLCPTDLCFLLDSKLKSNWTMTQFLNWSSLPFYVMMHQRTKFPHHIWDQPYVFFFSPVSVYVAEWYPICLCYWSCCTCISTWIPQTW